MTDFYSKARVAIVRIGQFEFNGLAWVDGKGKTIYGLAASQVAEEAKLAHPQNAVRTLKRALGLDSPLFRVASELNSNKVSVVTIDQFARAIVGMAINGHEGAKELALALAGVALHQVFADAFGDRFEAEDRQEWLNERLCGKDVRRTFTDAIKSYILRHRHELSDNAIQFMYSNATDILNCLLFGLRAKKMCEVLNCDRDHLRDHLDRKELLWLQQVEDVAVRLIDEYDVNPVDAVRQAHERILAPQSPRIQYLLTGEFA